MLPCLSELVHVSHHDYPIRPKHQLNGAPTKNTPNRSKSAWASLSRHTRKRRSKSPPSGSPSSVCSTPVVCRRLFGCAMSNLLICPLVTCSSTNIRCHRASIYRAAEIVARGVGFLPEHIGQDWAGIEVNSRSGACFKHEFEEEEDWMDHSRGLWARIKEQPMSLLVGPLKSSPIISTVWYTLKEHWQPVVSPNRLPLPVLYSVFSFSREFRWSTIGTHRRLGSSRWPRSSLYSPA